VNRNRLPGPDDGLPAVDEHAGRLLRAGWSCGEVAAAGGWLVTGANGENVLHAAGPTQTLAWRRAVEMARSLGMLR
jgi:hypothetical protein